MTHTRHVGPPDDEREAFAAACRAYERSDDGFEVSWEEQCPDHGYVDHVERVVTVRALGTSSEPVNYDAGPGTHWIDGFAADLAAGVFDAAGPA